MLQPSWSNASSITQPSWRWSYKHGKSYARWLHNAPTNTRKDYHASTFMIIRIRHNPTILALDLSTWKELHKMVTSHTDQYTKRISCINLHDHTHQPKPNHLGFGVMSMENATQDGYITHRSIHEKIIMYQPSWSYASSITQPSCRWSYQHGKSYARWLHHKPIDTRKDYHASTFMIIRIKHNPTILTLFQLHLISRAQWSLVKIKTALRIMINIRRCDQTSRWISWLRYLRFDVIENRSIHEKIIMHQPSPRPSWRSIVLAK